MFRLSPCLYTLVFLSFSSLLTIENFGCTTHVFPSHGGSHRAGIGYLDNYTKGHRILEFCWINETHPVLGCSKELCYHTNEIAKLESEWIMDRSKTDDAANHVDWL